MADVRSIFQGFDLDSGAGSDLVLGVNLRLSASGGSAEALGQKAMASSLPVVIASDQSALSVDTELPSAAALADGASNPTTVLVGSCRMTYNGTSWDRGISIKNTLDSTGTGIAAVGITAQVDDTSITAVTENQFGPLRMSTRRALLVEGVASGTAMSVDTELPAAAALADAASNPTTPLVGACLLGFNGTSWDRLYTVANAASYASGTKGLLILGQNGTTDYRALSVDSTGSLNVNASFSAAVPSGVANTYVTSSAVTAGSSANLDTGDLGAVKLTSVEVWSTVAFKAFVYRISNSSADANPVAVGGGQAFNACRFEFIKGYVSVTSTAGTDGFRVAFTNLDDNLAADAYATFHTES